MKTISFVAIGYSVLGYQSVCGKHTNVYRHKPTGFCRRGS